MYHIYLIRNSANGMQYVGVTRRSLATRLKEHRNVSNSINCRSALHNAIKEFGPQQFGMTLLENCASEDEMFKAETQWITTLGTLMPAGYNMNIGRPWKGPIYHTEETKAKMAASHRGKKFTEAHKHAMSINHHDVSGANHPLWGKHVSKETRQKMSAAQKGRQKTQAVCKAIKNGWIQRKAKAIEKGLSANSFKPIRIPDCHPDRSYRSKGMCAQCYDNLRYKTGRRMRKQIS